MTLSLNILLVITCAVLNRLAGYGDSKHAKLWRRVGVPILIMLYGLLKHRWWSIASLPLGFGVFCLPITLVGNDIRTDWINYPWLYILGILIGLISIPHSFIELIFCFIYGIIFGTLVVLSNLKKTREIFLWSYVELVYGGLLGLLTVLVNHV